MPSTRSEARTLARAIPLVTVSLASGSFHQTRLADNIGRSTSPDNRHHDNDEHTHEDHPPPYEAVFSSNPMTSDSSNNSNTSNTSNEVATASPSNQDLTEAVIHLSRTLVSTPKAVPRPTSTWVFMMIYSWTHTQQTATRILNILTKPSTFLKEIQGQNDQALVPQEMKHRKSIQQMTEEQDMEEDDPDMLNGATEMMPVSMMNIRSVATMEESLPEDPEAQSVQGDSSDDESITPGKPRRRIDQYSNPFGTGVSSEDDPEDEEEEEDGHSKTNSVRLTSQKLSQRRIPDFSTSALGPAMDPRQYESGDDARSTTAPSISSFSTGSLFNTPRNATLNRPASTYSRTSYSSEADFLSPSTISNSTAMSPHSGRQSPAFQISRASSPRPQEILPETQDGVKESAVEQDHHRRELSLMESSRSDHLRVRENTVLSTSATFTEFAPTVFSTSASGHSISSSSSILSFEEAAS
ncbi:hypothetical protein EDD21DRAFT_415726 [Dissophora ornata]|nr:hypothetical protein BGZ58_010612 [Dissophora ornata]KAI8600577.1 hypothetical protein EDD21DRAFT_415726 [Dissophora ornata]